MKTVIGILLFFEFWFVNPLDGFSQCVNVQNDKLSVGGCSTCGPAVTFAAADLIDVKGFNGLYCGFSNPAVRLDVTGKTYFGQFSLASNNNTLQNCMLASEGDVILRENPGANPSNVDQTRNTNYIPHDLILTNQSAVPWAQHSDNSWHAPTWPWESGGRIRFLTSTNGENEVMRLTSSGHVGLGTRWDAPQLTDPVAEVQVNDRLTFDGGSIDGAGAPHIDFNQYASNAQYISSGGTWHSHRMSEGTSAQIGLAPNLTPAGILDKELRDALYFSVNEYGPSGGDASSDITSNSNNFVAAHSKWTFVAPAGLDGDHTMLRIQCQIKDPGNPTGPNLMDPYVYSPHLLCVGTDGINNGATTAWQGTGQFNLTGTTHTENLMLAVKGLILCEEVVVKISNPPWPDYVFNPDYKLMPLSDLERSVKENKHLPDMPSEKEIQSGGINVTDLEAKLVKKVEELTLYMIELKKENELLKKEIERVKQH